MTVNPYRTEEFQSSIHLVKEEPIPDCADANCVQMIRSALMLWAVIVGFVWIVVEVCRHI